jgi:hypothetical protein
MKTLALQSAMGLSILFLGGESLACVPDDSRLRAVVASDVSHCEDERNFRCVVLELTNTGAAQVQVPVFVQDGEDVANPGDVYFQSEQTDGRWEFLIDDIGSYDAPTVRKLGRAETLKLVVPLGQSLKQLTVRLALRQEKQRFIYSEPFEAE